MGGTLNSPEPVVLVEDLYFSYPPLVPGDPVVDALQGVSLLVNRGELVAVLGPSGSGKSTLCLALCSVVPHSTGGRFGGRVVICGQDTRRATPAQLSARVGVVFQDPESQLFATTVEDEVAFGLESQGMARSEMQDRVAWALALVGMADHRLRSPVVLSGGQKQRVAIAAAIATRPDLLILDEPTASLDPAGAHEVALALADLRQETDCAQVMVTQDAELAAAFADRALLMDRGTITADVPVRDLLRSPSLLLQHAISPPPLSSLTFWLREHGVAADWNNVDDAVAGVRRLLEAEGSCLP